MVAARSFLHILAMDHSSRTDVNAQPELVLVTGATGMLGSNLVRALAARGLRVRGLCRSPEKARRYLADVDCEIVEGDMRDVASFAHALAGCSRVFHTAAYFREYYRPGDHDRELEAINVQGTLALMQAADSAGVRCFVHTSSSGAVGMKPDGSPGDEDTPAGDELLQNGYFRSKVDGDRKIHAFKPQHGMRVIEILPGFMFGPGDAAPTASGQLVLDFLAGKLPIIPEGGTNMVDARDVASAMITCSERAEHGARYIVAGESRTLAEVLRSLEELTGVRGPRRKVPFAVVMAYAWVEELRARITGGPLLVSREGIKVMRMRHTVSSQRAMRELGVKFRPFSETLRDVLAWYRQEGWVGAPRMAAGTPVRSGA